MEKTNKTALVTGSGQNIGRACVVALASEGIDVIINGSNDTEACEETAELARGLGVRAEVAMGDVGTEDFSRYIVRKLMPKYGSIDILINNAAIRPSGSFLEVSNEDWQRVINVNFMGAFWLSRACIPGMLEKGWGRIINFAGMNAIHGYNGRAHVSASKHATWGMTKALAKEFGAKGITSNIVSPGPIAGQHKDPAMAAHIADMVARVPVGRLGTSEEVAATCVLLISEKGAFINGQLIQVNGGTET